MRVTTEEFALDSYQNLLFGIMRFKEVTGRWPAKITVVGYEMKRRRSVLSIPLLLFILSIRVYARLQQSAWSKDGQEGSVERESEVHVETDVGDGPVLTRSDSNSSMLARSDGHQIDSTILVSMMRGILPHITPARSVL